MQAPIDQVCWVPIDEIVEGEAAQAWDAADDTVLLSLRGDGRYQLLAGGGRLLRCRMEGKTCVDAVICPSDQLDKRISSLLDKLVRGRLHYLEEAQAYRSLMYGDGLDVKELTARTGRSSTTIRRKLRLLNLGEEVLAAVKEHGLSERFAELLLRVPGQQSRLRVLKQMVAAKLDYKAAETLVDSVLSRMPIPLTRGRQLKPLVRDYRLYLNGIRSIVEQMQDVGVNADMQVHIGRSAADVRISLPLFTNRKG